MRKIVYSEQLNDEEIVRVKNLASKAGLSYEIARLLYCRGYRTDDQVKRFLHPDKKNFFDPFLLDGMKEAVERINAAKENGETVLVFGDYDVDGVSATAIMHRALKEYGVNVLSVVPERQNGYGLNNEIVSAYAEDYFIDLVITVDCGISDYEKVEFIKNELGIDVIITDHHEVPEVIPDTIIINPKLSKNYPFDALCGAGVALKIAYALLGDKADKFIDLAATATVADSVPLVGENRDIVAEGLKIYKSDKIRSVYKHLLDSAGVKDINSKMIAFSVAPRINAAGRMGDAAAALKLFLSDDEDEIFRLSALLTSYNIERQTECDKLYRSAKEKIEKEGSYRNIIMLYDESWQTGFVGIVAAKLVDEYSRPVIMFAGTNGLLKGSARSVDGVNVFEVISATKEYLVEFGGHAQAAGLAIQKENFEAFYEAADKYISENYSAKDFVPQVLVEGILNEKLTFEFADELALFEPCGMANRIPLFCTEVKEANAVRIKPGSPHVTFQSPFTPLLCFGGEKYLEILNLPVTKKIVFEVNDSYFGNKRFLKGIVKYCMPAYDVSDDVSDVIFEKQVLSLKSENNLEYIELTTAQIAEKALSSLKCKYGTAYVFGNPENVKKFDFLSDVQISLFEPSENNLRNIVIIAPVSDINGFENVFYMDNPPKLTVHGKSTYLNTELSGTEFFNDLSLDRAVFADIFLYLKKRSGMKFEKVVDFYNDNVVKYSKKQFILCTYVFIELGIFDVADGVFRFNPSVKSDLKKSVIYTRTEEILRNDI